MKTLAARNNVFSLLTVTSLGLLACSALAQDQEKATLTMADAKRYAIAKNHRVQALRAAVDEAKARRDRLSAAFYPRLGVATGMDASVTTDAEEVAPIGYLYGTYNLFNGFRDTRRSDIAAVEVESEELKIQFEELLIGNEVELQFHTFLYYQELIDLKEEAAALNQQNKRLVAQTRAAGMASATDEMAFTLKEAELKSELVSLQLGQHEARIALKNLLGETVGGAITPAGKMQHQHLKHSLMDYVARIQDQSAPIKVAAKREVIATLESRLTRARWLPSIDFEVRGGYLPLDERERELPPPDQVDSELTRRDEAQLSLLLTARLELFSGFESLAEGRERAANGQEAEASHRAEILTALTNMETYFRRLKAIEERSHLELGNAALGRKFYRAVVDEYRRGVKNSGDVSDAADRMFEAAERKLRYEFEFLTERLALERTVGAPVEVEIVDHGAVESGGGT